MSISDYLENKILDKVFKNTDFTVTAAYVALHTGDPGEDGANELAVGTSSYVRQVGTFSSAASGATENSVVATFTNLPAGTVTHVGAWNAATVGNFLWGGTATATKVINDGDTVSFAVGAIDVSLD